MEHLPYWLYKLWLMKRIIRIVTVLFILILGLTAIYQSKDTKLQTQNEMATAQHDSDVTHTEPPKIEEPPKEVVDTKPAGNVQSTGYITATGDCMLAYNYDWPKDIAYQFCMKESGGRADATNWTDNHGKCMGSYGLFQIGCFWFPYYGYGDDVRYNPQINTEIAYNIWKRQGNFKAWSACRLVPGCY